MKRLLRSLNLLATILGIVLFVLAFNQPSKAQGYCSGGCPQICLSGYLCQTCKDGDNTVCTVWYGPEYNEGNGGVCLMMQCNQYYCASVCFF